MTLTTMVAIMSRKDTLDCLARSTIYWTICLGENPSTSYEILFGYRFKTVLKRFFRVNYVWYELNR